MKISLRGVYRCARRSIQTGQRNIEVLRALSKPQIAPSDATRGNSGRRLVRLESATGAVTANIDPAIHERRSYSGAHGWWYPETRGQENCQLCLQ